MSKKAIKISTLVAASFSLAACQSGSTTTGTTTTASPAVTAVVSTAGEISATTGLRQFPDTISGGDSFQVNATNDASFATLINAVRADAGASPLAYNAKLDAAAQAHSDDMAATGVFSHTGSGGTSVGDRATAAGYVWTSIGENIAKGQTNENQAMNGWVNSAPHQANNVNTDFKEFGLARTGSGADTYWTLVFGAQ